ncbi:MAG: glycosyltransferase family 4 protein [Flavobacteriaceae bacterium]|nr:glycosyltransferase family 4 protein [Flavobacteriaceae bacterium]
MNQHYEIVGVASTLKELKEVELQEGIRTHGIEMTRTISPVKDIKAVFQLYRFLRKEKPFIVHTHTPKAGIVGMMAAWLAGVKHRYHTVAGMPLLEATGLKRKVLNLVEKLTYKFATKVFPNSNGQRQIIIDEGFAKPEKLKVIGKGSSNGIDVNHFDPTLISEDQTNKLRSDLGISEDELVMVYIGRLVKDKGINELVEAFDKFSKLGMNGKLVLVGKRETELDPLDPATEKIISDNPGIISAGWQDDVRPFLSMADVFVFPTYREGFPNVVLQAGAMGVPAIVTDINGCNEIIKNQLNGIIIPTKDSRAILDAMILLAKDAATRREMQTVARENIVENYQQTYIWSELLKLYKSTEISEDVS